MECLSHEPVTTHLRNEVQMRTWRFGLLLHTCRKDMVSGADVVRTCLREAQTTSSHDIARARHETQHYHKITKPCRPSVGASAWLGPQEKKMSNWFACLFQIRNRRKKILHGLTSWCNFVVIAVEFVLNYDKMKNSACILTLIKIRSLNPLIRLLD